MSGIFTDAGERALWEGMDTANLPEDKAAYIDLDGLRWRVPARFVNATEAPLDGTRGVERAICQECREVCDLPDRLPQPSRDVRVILHCANQECDADLYDNDPDPDPVPADDDPSPLSTDIEFGGDLW